MGVTVAESNRLLDASFGTTSYTAPTTPMKMRLMTANGDATTAGTEVTGGSYAGQTIAFASASAESVAESSTPVNFTSMPACVVAGVEIWDSAGTPRRQWWGTMPQIAYTVVASTDVFTATAHGMANGDAVQFYTGNAPTGLTANTTYYVINTATNTFKVSATVNGSAMDVTADGSGNVIKCATYTAGNTASFPASTGFSASLI